MNWNRGLMKGTMTDTCTTCGLEDAPYYDDDGRCPLCIPDFGRSNVPTDAPTNGHSAVMALNGSDKHQLSRLIATLAEARISEFGGVRKAAKALTKERGHRVTPGVISLARKGRDIPSTRRAVGLPQKPVPVEPCPDCGKIHDQLHTCPHELAKQRSGPKRWRHHYECGRGSEGAHVDAEIRSEMEAAGVDSFTEYVDLMRSERC